MSTPEGRKTTPTMGIITALPHEDGGGTRGLRRAAADRRAGCRGRPGVLDSRNPLAAWRRASSRDRAGGHGQQRRRHPRQPPASRTSRGHFNRHVRHRGRVPSPGKAEAHVRLGDVVVSSQKGVVQYDFVKRTVKKQRTDVPEEIRSSPRPPSALLVEAVSHPGSQRPSRSTPVGAIPSGGLARLEWEPA